MQEVVAVESTTAEARISTLAEAGALIRSTNAAIESLLAHTCEANPGVRADAEFVLQVAELIGHDQQAREGQLTMALADAHRVKANRGGLVPWITKNLDLTPGAARSLALSAREIGRLPQLAESLISGRYGFTTMRALTRTARATKGTKQDLTAALAETLELATNQGVSQANRHVRILEETLDPGRAEELLAKQRQRSFFVSPSARTG